MYSAKLSGKDINIGNYDAFLNWREWALEVSIGGVLSS